MVFTTKCPKCGKILWFSGKIAGTMTICPACGSSLRLEAADALPQGTSGNATDTASLPRQNLQEHSSQNPVEGDDQIPPAAEESTLAHQAAAAAGESHVDIEESDLVQWTQPQSQPPPTHMSPPAWVPTPLSGENPPPQSAQDQPWWTPSPASRTLSIVRKPAPDRDDSKWKMMIVAVCAVAAAIALVVGLLVYLPKAQQSSAWEQTHRDELLSMKQNAEDLALAGKDREAYEKYQELERLVSGKQIDDPHLRDELEKSWHLRDQLLQKLTAAGIQPPLGPQTEPGTTEESGTPTTQETTPNSPQNPPVLNDSTPATAPSGANPISVRPSVHATPQQVSGITDAQIGASIAKGVDFLLTQFDGAQLGEKVDVQDYHDGLYSLVVYSLMQSGLATQDKRLDIHTPFMQTVAEAMKQLSMKDEKQTYAHAIRATALAVYNRREDQPVIRQDVNWLLSAQSSGAFTYTDQFPRNSDLFFWDNSNSQYGLLGIWSGAETGIRIPSKFWRDVQEHWSGNQLADGQWLYRKNDKTPTRSMTLAGIASLFVAQDYLDAEDWGDRVGRPPFSPALAKGLAWLEYGDNSVISPDSEQDWTYTLYGLERAGLASGFKFFGSHDWYRERAADAMALQNADGSWSAPYGNVVATSYSLLFLSRGRHPLIMNKLRFGGDWANRPRDVANLARFASSELERPLNWQVVPLDHDWHDWTDSPILYLASHRAPDFGDDDRAKLRAFILNGGMLLMQADGGSEEFSRFVLDLGQRLFPQYGWIDLPADSPLLSVSYKITNPPKVQIITNGSRILMMHWPQDITHAWQLRQEKTDRGAFEFGVNTVLYAAGKSELRNRLQTEEIATPATAAAASLQLARLRYDGNWDPEPAAWPRAAKWFRQQTSLDIALEPTAVEDLASTNPPIAHLTGTAAFKASDAEVDSVKKYVENGGVLLVDPCGTPGEFLLSIDEDLLPRAFPNAQLQPMDAKHPLLTASADGMEDISIPSLREFVRTLPEAPRALPSILKFGKGHVIVLPLDLTSGLLGTPAWGIAGYKPTYALSFMKNAILWTWDGAKDGS